MEIWGKRPFNQLSLKKGTNGMKSELCGFESGGLEKHDAY